MFYITEKNWNKILGYAEEAYNEHKSEIGGMSVMVKDKDDNWELQAPVILEQEISSGNTILDKDALAIYYTKQAKKMGKKEFRFCWWHSHHTMAAFWSSTDLTAIDEYSDGDFSFALVINLKGEYKFRTSIWKPFAVHQDVELEVLRNNKCNKHMKKEVEALCSTITRTYTPTWNNRRGYQSSDQQQERLPFDYTTPIAENVFTDLTIEVDELNDSLIDGSIDYKTYSTNISNLNKKLKKDKSPYKIELIPENRKEELLYMLPTQLIKYNDTGINVYDEDYFLSGVV
tara:strand:- start:3535 stop:4395 length:861 start_codon:yes stop_codon:yes gene_type:complete